jgi:hypothetical protein
VDILYRICVQTINGVDNRFGAKAMEKNPLIHDFADS